jgi:putative transposase
MRKTRFSDEQIVASLQEADGAARRARTFGGTASVTRGSTAGAGSMAGREAPAGARGGDRRLKRVVADQALNLQVLKDVLGKEW